MKEQRDAEGLNKAADEREPEYKIPLIEEAVEVETQEVETGAVRVTKTSEVKEVPVDISLSSSHAEVQRFPINRVVNRTFGSRQEGDTLIVPVFEEILIKQLLLKEEVHIRIMEETHQIHEQFEVREEKVLVERYDAINKEWKSEGNS